jgi:hypothetical protein
MDRLVIRDTRLFRTDFELIADPGPTQDVHLHPRQDQREHALNYDWSRIVSQTASVYEL